MAVITISREYLSWGETIAKNVAKELGYHFVTKDTFEKILRQYGLVQLDELHKKSNFWAYADSSNQELISMLNKTMLGFAQLDNVVILGRGGFAVLREYANVLNVRIQAPSEARARRLMELEALEDFDTARKQINDNDKARASFVKGFYGADTNNANSFQLVLDTGVIPADTAAKWIVEAVQALDERSYADEKTTKNIEVDPILAGAIQQVLESA